MKNIESKQKQKFNIKAFLVPKNSKEIMSLTIHIFFQLFIITFISQVNVILFSLYEPKVGSDQLFAAAIAKATTLINAIAFIPTLIASGTLVVGGNLFGQKKEKELPSLITSGIILNFFITTVIFIVLQIFAKDFLYLLDATDEVIQTNKPYNNWVEIDFCATYFRLNIISLLVMSITQVYISGLQVSKKQKEVAIGAVTSNFVDVIIVSLVLYVFKANPVYAGFAVPAAALCQMIYMTIVNFKYIDYKGWRLKDLINKHFMIETAKVGLPITLEIGLWNLCNFFMVSSIANINVPASYDSSLIGVDPTGSHIEHNVRSQLINLNTRITSVMLYSSTFMQAIGTVTSILVAKKAGSNDKEGAFKMGVDCWKICLYGQLILSTITFAIIYPLLLFAFNLQSEVIIRYGILVFSILFIKAFFDTVNMTLLRSLWSVGDLWVPLIISIFTMVLFMVGIPFGVVEKINLDPGYTMCIILSIVALDPICRSIIYIFIWFRKKWFKYVKTI